YSVKCIAHRQQSPSDTGPGGPDAYVLKALRMCATASSKRAVPTAMDPAKESFILENSRHYWIAPCLPQQNSSKTGAISGADLTSELCSSSRSCAVQRQACEQRIHEDGRT